MGARTSTTSISPATFKKIGETHDDDQKNTPSSPERGMHEDEFTPKFRDPNDPEFVHPPSRKFSG
jgi:hypothetical protein